MLAFLCCFVVGFGVHVLSYFGIDPRDEFKVLWNILQWGSALALIMALLLLAQKENAPDSSDKYLTVLVSGFGIFMAYAIFTFLFTGMVLNHDATPKMINGQYVLFSHGGVSKPLTEGEFIKHRIYEARMNSGHWMAFYLIAAAAMYKRARQSV